MNEMFHLTTKAREGFGGGGGLRGSGVKEVVGLPICFCRGTGYG